LKGARSLTSSRLIPVAILLLALALRMVNISGRPLWYDEAFAVLYAEKPLGAIVYGTVAPAKGAGAADVHPLLYYFGLHFWMAGAGETPLAVRFPSVWLGVIAVALAYALAKLSFGERVGLLASFLAAIHPFHIAYSQEARMYSLLATAFLFSTYAFLRATSAPTKTKACFPLKWWVMYGAAAAITIYSHNLGAFFLLSLNLLPLIQKGRFTERRRQILVGMVVGNAIALLLFSPWLIGVLPGQLGFVRRAYWITRPGLVELINTFIVFHFNLPLPRWMLPWALLISFVWPTLLIYRAVKVHTGVGMFLWLAWAPAASMFVISQWVPIYLIRALVPSVLLYTVALGWLAVEGDIPRFLCRGLLGVTILAVIPALAYHYTYALFPRPPFQELDAFLRDNLASGEVIVHDNKLTFFPAYYYDRSLPQYFCPDLPGSGSDTLALPTQQSLGLFATPVSQVVTPAIEGVWYVAFERSWEDYRAAGLEDSPYRAWLRTHCRQEGPVHRIGDLEIYHFVGCK